MTNRDPGWLQAHADDEDDWKRWEESPIQQVDFAVHIHYLHKYLQENMRVLEIGAGAGRFTKELADVSNRIVVADISPSKLQRNKRNAEALGYADAVEEWCECDMLNLHPNFGTDEFDAVVCYGGPLSYVFDRREKAIRELVRVTRPGGTLCLSAKSLWGTVHAFLPTILNVDPKRQSRSRLALLACLPRFRVQRVHRTSWRHRRGPLCQRLPLRNVARPPLYVA